MLIVTSSLRPAEAEAEARERVSSGQGVRVRGRVRTGAGAGSGAGARVKVRVRVRGRVRAGAGARASGVFRAGAGRRTLAAPRLDHELAREVRRGLRLERLQDDILVERVARHDGPMVEDREREGLR